MWLLVLSVSFVLAGCGGAHSIEPGIPENTDRSKTLDPGGGVVPDMKGGKPTTPPI
jgi:hypothetical protein